MSEVELFSYKGRTDFWDNINSFIHHRNTTYVPAQSSNAITLANIEFPEVDFSNLVTENISTSISSLHLTFINCVFDSPFITSNLTTFNNLTLSECTFNSSVEFKKNIKKLTIHNSTFNSKTTFVDVHSTTNDNKLTISSSTFKSNVSIIDCDFLAATLFDVDFTQATLNISKSNLIGLKLNEIRWGKRFNASRDTFRQLKVVMEEHKNIIDAHFFHSRELNAYKKELWKDWADWKTWRRWGDRLIFASNWLVSDFSQSWFRPLFWLIFTTIVLYAYLYHIDAITKPSWNNGFLFMNPFNRSVDDTFKNIYTYWFIHKIFSILFVYHIIVAFKRYSKA